jgi:hypothetical protein
MIARRNSIDPVRGPSGGAILESLSGIACIKRPLSGGYFDPVDDCSWPILLKNSDFRYA